MGNRIINELVIDNVNIANNFGILEINKDFLEYIKNSLYCFTEFDYFMFFILLFSKLIEKKFKPYYSGQHYFFKGELKIVPRETIIYIKE